MCVRGVGVNDVSITTEVCLLKDEAKRNLSKMKMTFLYEEKR